MELVVDATVLFAAIIGKGKTNELFFKDTLRLVALPYLIKEFNGNIGTIAKICGASEAEVKGVFEILKERIEIFPIYKFPDEIQSKAEKLAPHSKDVPYFALALHLGCAIWSREDGFKKQDVIKVYSTPNLVDMFLVGVKPKQEDKPKSSSKAKDPASEDSKSK
ncbi:MAG: PIN domain-containing protein [Nanoarchaeota archaeon]